ncbi:unnamed protein product, partial [Mesorhabditis belari]|uniref:Uncharacterized protein n=1 Tax=Mesorhabditis belari TaxID=2138241 RepID=A0AAF3EDP2_9BILA
MNLNSKRGHVLLLEAFSVFVKNKNWLQSRQRGAPETIREFERSNDALKAVEGLDGTIIDGGEAEQKLTVCRAQKRSERAAELKHRALYEQFKIDTMQRCQGVNLYMKNLDDEARDEQAFCCLWKDHFG